MLNHSRNNYTIYEKDTNDSDDWQLIQCEREEP